MIRTNELKGEIKGRTSIVTNGPQEPVKCQAQTVLSCLIGDCNFNEANVKLR